VNVVKAIAIAVVVALGAALTGATADAQQPTAAAPHYPNWCSGVPASPPPPKFDTGHPGHWAAVRKMCMNAKTPEMGCGDICRYAKDLWRMQKSGRLNQPDTFPSPTDEPQGPFPLPGGGSGFILPKQPAPSGPTSDGADALSAALSAVLPPGTFSSFPVKTSASSLCHLIVLVSFLSAAKNPGSASLRAV